MIQQTNERKILTPEAFAEEFNLTTGTLANWRCKKVGPPFYRLNGKKIIYFRNDVEAWARREPVLTEGA